MKINQQVLELFGKELEKKIESKEFVEFMNQSEAGNEILTNLKENYLEENKFPSKTNVNDIMWNVVATAYAPYVSIGDAVLNMIGSDTFPDSQSLISADFKTFFNFILNLIGKGVSVEVSTDTVPKDISEKVYEDDDLVNEVADVLLSNFDIGRFVESAKYNSDLVEKLEEVKSDYIKENITDENIVRVMIEDELSESDTKEIMSRLNWKEGVYFVLEIQKVSDAIIKENQSTLSNKNKEEVIELFEAGEEFIYTSCLNHPEWWDFIVKVD